jgi:hypothetical protein
MRRTDAIAWVLSVCAPFLRLSQAKTLSRLVAAAMVSPTASTAAIGRGMLGRAKHAIKRVCRFVANDRVEVGEAMTGVVRRLTGKRKRRLTLALDWVDVRQMQTLMAAAVVKGRAVPILWSSCRKHVYDGHHSRNAFEESLLLLLLSMLPKGVKITLLADRGFGRTELARFCQNHGLRYVIRIQPNVHIRCRSFTGKLCDYPVRKGICKLLKSVAYRQDNQVSQNIVVRWIRDLPTKRDNPWFLMTDLPDSPAAISRLYGRRMSCEQLFRDLKSKRNGYHLRDTRITDPARLDRLLLILTLAYLLLIGIGLHLKATCHPSLWSGCSRNDCSLFTIARACPDQPLRLSAALNQLLDALDEEVGKWG